MRRKVNGLELAQKFHEAYERLAPSFGYETRKDTKAFDPDSPNGKLMIAVCQEVGEIIASKYYDEGAGDAWRESRSI